MGKYREIIGGSVFFLCAAAYYVMAFGIQQYGANDVMDSAFIPKVYGVLIMILSILQVVFGVLDLKKGESKEKSDETGNGLSVKQQLASALITFAMLIVYVALLDSIGFIIMSSLFIFCMTLLLIPEEKRQRKQLIMIAGIAVSFSVVVYLLFVEGFALTLPAGILG